MQINQIIWSTALYLLVINLAAFLTFAYDKYCARNDMWRVRESTLLMLSLVGGTIGSMIGQSVLRHKTYKQPFGSYLYSIAFLQVFILLVLVVPQSRQALLALF